MKNCINFSVFTFLDGSTGEYSVYAKLAQFEIMFHVAPLLPHQPDDLQQVERKRHLGNDVVLLVFMHPAVHSFDVRILTSHFNSAFLCVRPTMTGEYELACASRADLRPVRPHFGATSRIAGSIEEVLSFFSKKSFFVFVFVFVLNFV